MWKTSKAILFLAAFLIACVSFAPSNAVFDMFPRWNLGLGMFASVQLASSVSENAVMMSRNMTGERLSPWRTPTDWGISAVSFPILRVTVRSEYNLWMALQNLGGAPSFLSMSMMSTWLDVSKALMRSANTTYVSRLCWRRR